MATFKHSLPLKQYINGSWQDSEGNAFLTLHSSVDDTLVTDKLSSATASDVDRAVESAEKGLKLWQSTPLEARRALLLKFADVIEENVDKLAYLEAIVCGKPPSFFKTFEAPTVAESFRYFAGFIDKNEGDLTLSEDGYLRGVLHQPLGICAAIIPFNSPTITFAMKVAPALATGNVIIVKVSETNPFSGLVLGELATQAGIPPGVVNVLCGAVEAGQALSSHLKIRKISFTGNPAVGRAIQIAAAKSNLKRVTLELGGKSPVLVFDDADLINAVTNTMAFLSLNGQGCVLGTRVYVQEGVADTFVAMVKEGVSQLAATLGADPFDERTFTSPLYHRRQRDIVAGFLEKGKSEATVITGGDTWGEKGCYVQPTIFYKPKPGSDVLTKEIFGPVLVVDTFQTESEVLDKANDSEYGLGAYVYTKNIDRAIRLSKALEAGSVAVNVANPTHVTLPFGGWKGSGFGSENSKYVLRAYTQPKSVTIKFEPSNA